MKLRHLHNLRIVCLGLALIAHLPRDVAAETAAPLRVGTSGDYAPFSFRDPNGTLSGFDIAVARRLARDLKREVEFIPFRWPDLVPQVENATFDVAMSGVTVTAERAVRVVYTRPYAVTGAVAVVRAAERQRYGHVADLNRAAVRVGVNAGGYLERVARRRFATAQVVPVSDNRALPDLLRRGDIDTAISEALEAQTWSAKDFATLGPFTHDCKAYVLAPNAAALAHRIDDWLAAREADGWLNQQRRRWLGARSVLTPAQAGFDALVSAIDLRLQLMPLVAAVKQREHLPIEDPAQEARVLERVRAAATAQGLDAEAVAHVFRVQIEAAKLVERAATAAPAPAELTLEQLRSAVGRTSDQLIAELARCQPWLHAASARRELQASLRAGLTVPGVTDEIRAKIRDSLLSVRHA